MHHFLLSLCLFLFPWYLTYASRYRLIRCLISEMRDMNDERWLTSRIAQHFILFMNNHILIIKFNIIQKILKTISHRKWKFEFTALGCCAAFFCLSCSVENCSHCFTETCFALFNEKWFSNLSFNPKIDKS